MIYKILHPCTFLNRLLLASLVAFLFLIGHISSGLANDLPTKDQKRMVALLEWVGKDYQSGYRLELRPLFIMQGRKYTSARVPPVYVQQDDCHNLPKNSTKIRPGQVYEVYGNGALVGHFTVRKTEDMGGSEQVGLGDFKLLTGVENYLRLDEPLVVVYPPLKNPWRTRLEQGGVEIDYETFQKRVVPQLTKIIVTYTKERFMGKLDGPSEVEFYETYLLNKAKDIVINIQINQPLIKSEEPITRSILRGSVNLNAWFEVHENRPPKLLMHKIYMGEPFDKEFGKDVENFRLLQLLDIDDDGQGELLYESGGYESHYYSIYSLTSPDKKHIFEEVTDGC